MTNNHLLSQAQSKLVKIFTMLKVQGMTHVVFKAQRRLKGFAQEINLKRIGSII